MDIKLEIIVRNSQDNEPVTEAVVSVSFDEVAIEEGVSVASNGTALIPVKENGLYSVRVEAEGFITSDFEMEVNCSSAECSIKRLVSLSPQLEHGETRIIMTWEQDEPPDVDLHVMAVKKSDRSRSTCRTFYQEKNNCEEISLDLDNTNGGHNGAETITLLDNLGRPSRKKKIDT